MRKNRGIEKLASRSPSSSQEIPESKATSESKSEIVLLTTLFLIAAAVGIVGFIALVLQQVKTW